MFETSDVIGFGFLSAKQAWHKRERCLSILWGAVHVSTKPSRQSTFVFVFINFWAVWWILFSKDEPQRFMGLPNIASSRLTRLAAKQMKEMTTSISTNYALWLQYMFNLSVACTWSAKWLTLYCSECLENFPSGGSFFSCSIGNSESLRIIERIWYRRHFFSKLNTSSLRFMLRTSPAPSISLEKPQRKREA